MWPCAKETETKGAAPLRLLGVLPFALCPVLARAWRVTRAATTVWPPHGSLDVMALRVAGVLSRV